MRFTTLNEWLDWQQSLHPKDIDLGLDRVREVAQRLDIIAPANTVITVAGTNGKGSTVSYYSHLLHGAGYSVGTYTSPHVLRYNERISINNQPLSDAKIMDAFTAIDKARGDISLTYFEFGTLAALYSFKKHKVNFAVLEVGLGGRLDAVNVVDADLVHFTPIGIDHIDWLGDNREQIAIEKAGVLRQGCKVVCNDPEPTQSMQQKIQQHHATALYVGKDYSVNKEGYFQFKHLSINLNDLAMQGEHQKTNCAGVLAGLMLLDQLAILNETSLQKLLSQIQTVGRFQTVQCNSRYSVILDVGHNADAAHVIADQLSKQNINRCVLILGMLKDKNIEQFVETLSPHVDYIICVTMQGPRALTAHELSQRVLVTHAKKNEAETMQQSLKLAQLYLQKQDESVSSESAQDIILISGSFLTVEAYLKL